MTYNPADPRWFWEARFVGGGTATYYADNKAFALDHGYTLARDFGRRDVQSVRRLKHSKDVTLAENAAAGKLREG